MSGFWIKYVNSLSEKRLVNFLSKYPQFYGYLDRSKLSKNLLKTLSENNHRFSDNKGIIPIGSIVFVKISKSSASNSVAVVLNIKTSFCSVKYHICYLNGVERLISSRFVEPYFNIERPSNDKIDWLFCAWMPDDVKEKYKKIMCGKNK